MGLIACQQANIKLIIKLVTKTNPILLDQCNFMQTQKGLKGRLYETDLEPMVIFGTKSSIKTTRMARELPT